MTEKKFELRTIVSFLNGHCVADTEEGEVLELASHLVQREVTSEELPSIRDNHVEHVLTRMRNPDNLVRINFSGIDKSRYAKMIDLFGKMHSIPSAV